MDIQQQVRRSRLPLYIVIEVIKEGYKFNGQILRPAQVIVSKAVQIEEDKSQEEIK